MAQITVRMAKTPTDYDIARALCREWLDWHWRAFPLDGPTEGNPMDPVAFETIVSDLPQFLIFRIFMPAPMGQCCLLS